MMEEQIQHSDILHGITLDVFQRVIDVGPNLREFISLAKQYHKALLSASVAANSFYQGFTKIAHLASQTRGSNKLLGKGICDIIAVHKQIDNQTNNMIKALSQDFIVPLEEWSEKEVSRAKGKQRSYIQDNRSAVESVEKSRADLVKVRKKSQRSKSSEKYEQKEQMIMSSHEELLKKLDGLRVSGCHEAINMERNMYKFIVERVGIVAKVDVVRYEKAYNMMNSRLPIWDRLVKQPLTLELSVNPLLKQLTENGFYDKSLDEHLSQLENLQEPLPPPNEMQKKAPIDKRFSHQFSVGSATLKHKKDDSSAQNKVKLQAVFAHTASDATQLSFDEGDIIKTVTGVTSGWQYGENLTTKKSGWFPVSFTEQASTMTPQTSINPSLTMPSSGHAYQRPSVLTGVVNGSESSDVLSTTLPPIPQRDYGVPLKDVKINGNNNNHSTPISSPSSVPDISLSFNPPPPPPAAPPSQSKYDDDIPFPPPPAPPPPPLGSYDQAL